MVYIYPPQITRRKDGKVNIVLAWINDNDPTLYYVNANRQNGPTFASAYSPPWPSAFPSPDVVAPNHTYTYWVTNDLDSGDDSQPLYVTPNAHASASGFALQRNPYELLVPRANRIFH